jgi:spore coat protein CotF
MAITLTQKERTLLEDQKNHEQICIGKYSNYANMTKDNQLKALFKNHEQIEKTHLNSINQILSGNVPQMNQQGQNSGQNAIPQATQAQTTGINISDKDMCTDMLMTEKYVSGAYDTAIFEFKDTGVRDVLNHIQKEEQKHGEAIYKYMESKGLYNAQ